MSERAAVAAEAAERTLASTSAAEKGIVGGVALVAAAASFCFFLFDGEEATGALPSAPRSITKSAPTREASGSSLPEEELFPSFPSLPSPSSSLEAEAAMATPLALSCLRCLLSAASRRPPGRGGCLRRGGLPKGA